MTGGRAERIRARLLQRGIEWPAELHEFDLLDSTNTWLRAAARGGAPCWTVALAEQQTAGRGRQGRGWRSPPGGLYASVLIEMPTALDSTRGGVLALMGGVAVAQALYEHGVAAALKWPNDVRVHGRKIAGLLAEVVAPDRRALIVLGIGVNVDLREDEVPEAMRGQTSSLRMEGVDGVDAAEVCAAVLARVRVCYDALAQGGAGAIVEQWRELSEPWWGREVEVSTAGQRWSGTVVGVDEDGALMIDRPSVGRCVVHAGDVDLTVRRSGVGGDGGD